MQGRMKRSCVRAYTLLLIGVGGGDLREDEERSGIHVPWSGCRFLIAPISRSDHGLYPQPPSRAPRALHF